MRILTTALACLLALTSVFGAPLLASGAEARRSATSLLDGGGGGKGGGDDKGDEDDDKDDDDEDVRVLG